MTDIPPGPGSEHQAGARPFDYDDYDDAPDPDDTGTATVDPERFERPEDWPEPTPEPDREPVHPERTPDDDDDDRGRRGA